MVFKGCRVPGSIIYHFSWLPVQVMSHCACGVFLRQEACKGAVVQLLKDLAVEDSGGAKPVTNNFCDVAEDTKLKIQDDTAWQTMEVYRSLADSPAFVVEKSVLIIALMCSI